MTLAVQNVTKRFGGLVAVDSVSFDVPASTIVGLIGPNGAGKTTLFNVVAGVYAPNDGEVLFEGQSIARHGPDEVCRRGLARTFQIPQPFLSMNVLEAVMIGSFAHTAKVGEAKRRALAVIERAGLGGRADVPTASLTVAEKKRLEVARAVATDPRLILLDEVMAGLTATEVRGILELIRSLRAQSISVLLVEHNLEAVMSVASRIVVLDYGKKIADGSPDEVVNDPAVIRAYLGDELVDA